MACGCESGPCVQETLATVEVPASLTHTESADFLLCADCGSDTELAPALVIALFIFVIGKAIGRLLFSPKLVLLRIDPKAHAAATLPRSKAATDVAAVQKTRESSAWAVAVPTA